METAQLISSMVDRIVDQFHPISIILFGSQARGDTNESSDVDLLVVMNEVQNQRHTAIAIQQLLRDISISVDIKVTTPDEIERRLFTVGNVIHEAFREGKVLYEQQK